MLLKTSKYTTNQLKINYQSYTSLILSFFIIFKSQISIKMSQKIINNPFLCSTALYSFQWWIFHKFCASSLKIGMCEISKISEFQKNYFWGSCKMKHMTAHRFASKSGRTFKWVTEICIPFDNWRLHHYITYPYVRFRF